MSDQRRQLVAERTEFQYFRSMRTSRLTLTALLALTPLSRPVASQQPDNPGPDERFKVDILVIAPHPDDETTIAGYLAKAVLDQHRRVAVVFTTRGDAGINLVSYDEGRTIGEIREIETPQALASEGIDKGFFLRLPD